MRRRRPERREILPDPVFNDLVVTKFVNNLMTSGKKSISEKIFYKSLEIIKTKTKEKDGLEIFKRLSIMLLQYLKLNQKELVVLLIKFQLKFQKTEKWH